MKFFQRGCSQISSAASAVSVHQHMARLNSSLSLKRGRNAEIALFMVASEASGYVSVGCFAWERGTETSFREGAPKGWCFLKRVKPGNSSHTFITPSLGLVSAVGVLEFEIRTVLLVGFEKEAEISVVYYGSILVRGRFLRCELHMGVYPGLTLSSVLMMITRSPWYRLGFTLEQHWSSKSTNVGLHAPAARTILSAKYCEPSRVSTPTQVVPSDLKSGSFKDPALWLMLVHPGYGFLDGAQHYLPKARLTPASLRTVPMALIAFAAASQPPSCPKIPFHPW